MAKLYPNIDLLEELAEADCTVFEVGEKTFEVRVEEVDG